MPINTGSIVEQFGLPLNKEYKGNILQTDHDVMFVVDGVKVGDDEDCDLQALQTDNKSEYVHLFSCSLTERFSIEDDH